MKSSQAGFTLIEVSLAIIVLGIIVAALAGQLTGAKQMAELQATSEVALDLVNYVDKVRRSPISTTPGTVTYPGGSPYTHTYIAVPAGSTVADFRTEYFNQTGELARRFPEDSPFDTPYTITMTADTAFVEVTVPMTDFDLNRASETVSGSDTVLRFYPSVEAEGSGTNRSASANFTQSFMSETVR